MIPDLLDYFPTNSIPLLKSSHQLGANSIYAAKTKFTVEIFKWWVLCALDERCMNPDGAQVKCVFPKDRFNKFANCFRYDQSVLNLLLLNQFQDSNKFRSGLGRYLSRH